jgi:predicted unusual protein kinase regulating ubiquinone biosynthesis (AarF/ABC1/UbiB family)
MKWEALLKLAQERLENEIDFSVEANSMTEDERFEEKETLKTVFEAG